MHTIMLLSSNQWKIVDMEILFA